MADFSSLKTAIQNAIRTNGNNEITGQLLQDILLSMVVVLGDEAITNVADDLSTETSQRQNADGTLQGNINAEATARAVADTALQNAINTINSNISNGYVYAGIATPSATPVTGKVFYIATTAGTYTNFGGLTVTKGINILKYNGSTWSQEQIIGIDDYPTAGSSKLALSGGIDAEIKSLVGYYTCGTAAATAAKTITASAYILLQGGSIKVKFTYKNTAADATLKIGSADAKPLFYGGRRAGSSNSWEAGEVVEIFYDGTNYMANNVMGGGAGDGAFDISVYNAVDGTPTPYADLAAALGTNGANIPDTLRKGGMSVKFIQGTVQSSDNKYVQYMYNGTSTDVDDFTNTDNWEKANLEKEVNDISTVVGLSNMRLYPGLLASDNKFKNYSTANSYFIPVTADSSYKIVASDSAFAVLYAFVKSIPSTEDSSADYATGSQRTVINRGESASGTVPSDAVYLYVSHDYNGNNWNPQSVFLDGFDYIAGLIKQVVRQYEEISSITSKVTDLEQDVRLGIMGNDYLDTVIDGIYFASSITDETIGSITKVRFVYSPNKDNKTTATFVAWAGDNIVVGGEVIHVLPYDKLLIFKDCIISLKNGISSMKYLGQQQNVNIDTSKIQRSYPIVADSVSTNPYISKIFDYIYINDQSIYDTCYGIRLIKVNQNIISFRLLLSGTGEINLGNNYNPSSHIFFGNNIMLIAEVNTDNIFDELQATDITFYGHLNKGLCIDRFYDVMMRKNSTLEKPSLSFTPGTFIFGDGTLQSNGDYSYTPNAVFVEAGSTLVFSGSLKSNVCLIADTDASGSDKRLTPIVIGRGGGSDAYIYYFSESRHVKLSCLTVDKDNFILLKKSDTIFLPGVLEEENSSVFNNLIKGLYINSLTKETISTITKCRVFKGFLGIWGVSFYDSQNQNVIDIYQGTQPDNTGLCVRNGNYVVVDYSKPEYFVLGNATYPDSYVDIPVTLIYENVSSLVGQAYLKTLIDAIYADNRFDELEQIAKPNYIEKVLLSPNILNQNGQIFYEGDTKSNQHYLVNAVMYPDGTIIGAREGGSIVKIALDGTETTLLTIVGASDWRGLFIDKDLNVYASPHSSIGSAGGFQMSDRGLYKLAYGASTMTKVISLYDTSSSDIYETQQNDDTIWTMCQDNKGYLYAGVYCHTVRFAPRIYRSTDGGNTWADYYDFLTLLPNGHHVHTIIYNEFNDALYAIIGEVNTVLKSIDNGTTWTNLNARCEYEKGSSMIAVKDGVLIGSDGGFQLSISKLLSDDKTVKTVARGWANTIFALRRSDVTGWIYAFTKIDSSVSSTNYMPPIAALTDPLALQAWKESSPAPTCLSLWTYYNNLVKDYYPDDAIRPQHCGILVSKDNGETWEVVHRIYVTSNGGSGFVTSGYFRNGECLTGLFVDNGNGLKVVKPIIISEGKHIYTEQGIDLDGEILVRTNSTNYIQV